VDADDNAINAIKEMAEKAKLESLLASICVDTGELHFAYHKLYVAGAYLGAAQDALRRSRSDGGRRYVDGARRALEEARADYADAVGYRVPPIECFMESR